MQAIPPGRPAWESGGPPIEISLPCVLSRKAGEDTRRHNDYLLRESMIRKNRSMFAIELALRLLI